MLLHFMVSFLIYFSKLFCEARTYENVALNKPAWQQHPHSSYPEWGADLAVDGRYSYLNFYAIQCMLSADNKSSAEWRVDLKGVHSIHHIFIYYREYSGYNDYFLGFSLYISNTTRKEDGVLCFKDTIYTRETIPNPLNISCRLNGRYVIYYNNRTLPPFPEGYSSYTFNDLCEVEVYGCPDSRYFGEHCSTPCHRNCLEGRCDVVDGTFLGCIPGYTGWTCETEIKTKQYVNKQHDQLDNKENTCKNTCIFPNGEYNQAMGNGEYQKLWDFYQRSLYA